MTPTLAATLAALALVDSTSFGTLLIPIWLMLTPGRPALGKIVVFLLTVAGFYLLVGIGLLAGTSFVMEHLDGALESPAAYRVQLVIGIALFAWSFRLGRGDRGAGRLTRWRERLTRTEGGHGPVVVLALTAALLEVATMLPYLGALASIGRSDLAPPAQVGVLAVYCFVMLVPALVLLTLRVVAARLVEPLLARVSGWMERSGGETTAWIVGIVGFLVARDALIHLPEITERIGVSLG